MNHLVQDLVSLYLHPQELQHTCSIHFVKNNLLMNYKIHPEEMDQLLQMQRLNEIPKRLHLLSIEYDDVVEQIKTSQLLDPRSKCHLLLYIYSRGHSTEFLPLFLWYMEQVGFPERINQCPVNLVYHYKPGSILFDSYFSYLCFNDGSFRMYVRETNLIVGFYDHQTKVFSYLRCLQQHQDLLCAYIENMFR